MYILNTLVDIEFIIQPRATPLLISDYDIAILGPDRTRTYTDSGLTTYTAPTQTAQGHGMTQFTPDQVGRWRFTFSTGVEGAYEEVSAIEIFVAPGNFAPVVKTSLTRPLVISDIGTVI